MKKINLLTFVIRLSVIQYGCVSDQVKFENTSLKALDLTSEKRISGKAGGLLLFGILPMYINGRQKSAYEDMMVKVGSGYHVVDINVRDQWKWAFIGTRCNTLMTALAYPIRQEKTATPVIPPAPVIDPTTQKLEELKRLYKAGHLTDTEYESARRKALGL